MKLVKGNGRLEAGRGFLYASSDAVWFLDAERVLFVVVGWGGVSLKSVPYAKASVERLAQRGGKLMTHGLAAPVREV